MDAATFGIIFFVFLVVVLTFCYAVASIALGYEEDENKNLIPDSWEKFFGRKIKKK